MCTNFYTILPKNGGLVTKYCLKNDTSSISALKLTALNLAHIILAAFVSSDVLGPSEFC